MRIFLVNYPPCDFLLEKLGDTLRLFSLNNRVPQRTHHTSKAFQGLVDSSIRCIGLNFVSVDIYGSHLQPMGDFFAVISVRPMPINIKKKTKKNKNLSIANASLWRWGPVLDYCSRKPRTASLRQTTITITIFG